ncbi:MAG: Fpg/Nei family DNA glycosylase [Polyangiaceae bacterium]|nr:Fpg/Nei family DNA glycosylase [Polyangiaceae bacterium]
MPEQPDVTVYVEHIASRTVGHTLERVRFASPFVLRTAVPPIREAEGKKVVGVRRLAKRIIIALEAELFIVIHLMVAGRFRFLEPGAKIPGKLGLAAFDFDTGSLILTEASTKKRASIHLVKGDAALADFDRGGIEPLDVPFEEFAEALKAENHTLKRALTDQTILSGIGNAYSDEILHRAHLSPLKQTRALSDDEMRRLYESTHAVLVEWIDRLRKEYANAFPEGVTAFREEMAVHGRYGKPCPVCGTKIQRIVYADNETNYCPDCQTEGRLLADRSLSRLLGKDWPRTMEELEEKRPAVQRKANPERSTKVKKTPGPSAAAAPPADSAQATEKADAPKKAPEPKKTKKAAGKTQQPPR